MDERKRAKHRALYLLERMDRTEQELRRKLQQNYPPDVVEEALEYVKSYHYIDDLRYAKNYIACKSQVKSRRQIEQELLMKKGISREILEQAYGESEEQDEVLLIRRWMEKKKMDPCTADRAELQKFYLFLSRRGFRSEDIRRALFRISEET
ncbi:MAG: regulatory protein RecX [Lachnospiraceae bacterium]|jgi:regulatory protein|nr:regulatory protein RecX [Lachnospiraceae bacterium]MCI8995149.1 regulatory protein RecX [Lachnospiraceae bacterium]MCI9132779.1 regulatory protein RecX [Lachnospiraceae bacterium]